MASSNKEFECPYCNRKFKSVGYQQSHMQQNKRCHQLMQKALGLDLAFNPIGARQTRSRARAQADQLGLTDTGRPAKAPRTAARGQDSRAAIPQGLQDEDAHARASLQGSGGSEEDADHRKPAANPRIGNKKGADGEGNGELDEDGDFPTNIDRFNVDSDSEPTSEDNELSLEGSVATLQGDNEEDLDDTGPPDESNINAFRAYCVKAKKLPELTDLEKRGVKLMDILRRKRTPLDTYDDVLAWHLEETGSLMDKEKLGKNPDYLSRKKLLRILKERYNMSDKLPFEKEIALPHCNARIKVICFSARNCVEQLLTDPRLTDEDFCFFNDDPMAPPPEKATYVGELNTGEAYRNAYNAYVDDPQNEIGIGVQFYIDGAVTGQFDNLSITALKMSLSCFTLDYRKKDQAWAIIGFVVNYSEGKSRGKKMFADSRHDQALEDLEGMFVGREGETSNKVTKAQDFHAQIETILSNYIPLETNGMVWDLPYRGKLYRNKTLVFWTAMVRADTDEAELLCGKYRSRGNNVKHLCRYCCCPNEETDDPNAKHEAKTISMIMDLIDTKDLEGLKAISQQYIDNAWYKVRFDPKYDTGIHGACPSEMLHAIHLGIFLYVRECFFAQIGPTSQLAKDIDALAQEYGALFRHNSERDLPNCKFTHGIKQKKKLMANEYRGVLLLIAAVLRSTKGREMLSKNKHFQEEAHVKDWLLLVESLLEWEAYLCEPKMRVADVKRLDHKNRFIMYLFAKICRRTEGMGLKVFKFHAIIHMARDILLYGVPKEHDTGSNESGHKVTKVAAKKNLLTFELQTATRLIEFLLVEWAMAEINGRRLCDYYGRFDPLPPEVDDDGSESSTSEPESSTNPRGRTTNPGTKSVANQEEPVTGGAMMEVYYGGHGDACIELKDRRPARRKIKKGDVERSTVNVGDELLEFLLDLQEEMEDLVEDVDDYRLPIYTQHKRNGQIFYGHPKFRGGGKWRDWALIDWGDEEDGGYGKLPGHIQCFVTLEGIDDDPDARRTKFGGIHLENGTYAVIESAHWVTEEKEVMLSDLFVPLQKDAKVDKKTGEVLKRRFFLADVDAIVSPLCVVPDIGAKPSCKYFKVKPRSEWVEEFLLWLRDPSALDDMTD